MYYIALIHTDADTAYGVSFPDFPGCIAAGDNFDEALAHAKEALAFHCQGMIEDGETVPRPMSFEDIKSNTSGYWAEFLDEAQIARVPLIMNIAAPKRVNISLDPGLLDAIDKAASEQGMTRSAFLASAALQHIG